MRKFLLLAPLLLAACEADEPVAPGGVSQGEAAALNDAAAMLDDNSLDADAIKPDPEDKP
ncbi:hypothetical protein DMC47_02815 [Nostoc sp. 3335mG]|nr:hypothetical protein DMC47_02815 [Nostoc sp. 3335mG]